ncbi:hypothetical protein EC973_007955 [Apophysomyces ossiformis]|uniref:Uncharacterized protein n=1 Tax=Apophysomyces ossiformis TaxID=679940 RepID=A0A8H7BRB1_9FUNG|nr:hypothetical protein EC973_007955 [Apophysomyces ossiformis]
MQRAKQRAGVPLDLITPKEGTKLPPLRTKPPEIRKSGIPADLVRPRSDSKLPPRRTHASTTVNPGQTNSDKWHVAGLASQTVDSIPDPIPSVTDYFPAEYRQTKKKDLSLPDDESEMRIYRQLQLKPPAEAESEEKKTRQRMKNIGNLTETLNDKAVQEMLQNRPKAMRPASLTERLIKVSTKVIQPDNPHLLKVAVIGAANAGKSTLVNSLVGEEVSVVSSKAHTTRERVLAVLSQDNNQVVFLDTPGVIPDNRHAKMNRTLATAAWRTLDEADHIAIVVDGPWALTPSSRTTEDFLLSRLKDMETPATLIFNKMDLLDHDYTKLQDVMLRYQSSYPFIKNVLYVSAINDVNLDETKSTLFNYCQPKPWIYPAEQTCEMPPLKRVEELIRVEFFKRLHQYIPYMLKQENVGWTELENGTLRIDQNIYVERESQQKIVIGANGMVINRVVENARTQISRALRRPIQLYIQVKTRKNSFH